MATITMIGNGYQNNYTLKRLNLFNARLSTTSSKYSLKYSDFQAMSQEHGKNTIAPLL